MTKIQSMNCRFCNRPVTLLKTIGTAKATVLCEPTPTLNITVATCKHLALTDQDGSVLTQHKEVEDIKKNHTVVLDDPPKMWEFDGSYLRIKDSETI